MNERLLRIVCSGLLLLVVTAGNEAAPYKGAQPAQKVIITDCGFPTDLAFSPDSKLLAVADAFRERVYLWDVAAGKIAVVLPHRHALRVLFSPDGKMVATAGKHIKLWEAASGKEVATFKYVPAHWMLFSADGKKLAAIGAKIVTILNVEKKEEECSYDVDRSRVLVSTFPVLKKPIYAVNRGKGKPIVLMDPFTNKEVGACENELELLSSLASDQEEKILVGECGDNRDIWQLRRGICLWDRKTGKKIAAMESPSGSGPLALSPDGKILAMKGGGYPARRNPFWNAQVSGIRFCEVPSGRFLAFQELSNLLNGSKDYDGMHALVFSPDGRLLAIASGNVHLWSLPDAWRKKK